MAEVIPMSSINILYNVPLSPDYVNTFYFESEFAQQNYFNTAFQKRTYGFESYQRKNRGWLRINAPYKDVFNANYLTFINTQTIKDSVPYAIYENKTFYAFITEVVYINDAVSEIHYEIDVIQTYMFNWVFHETFIERETVRRDTEFDYYLDEGLPTPEFVNGESTEMLFKRVNIENAPSRPLSEMDYVVAATVDELYHDKTDDVDITQLVQGAISGCRLLRFGSPEVCKRWLENLPGEKFGAILGIYLVPRLIIEYQESNPLATTSLFHSGFETLDGYVPKNKKLYHSPYFNVVVQSSDGIAIPFDITLLDTKQFLLAFSPTTPFTGTLYPVTYKKNTLAHQQPGVIAPSIYAIPLPQLPTFTWSNDTYKAWAALNSGFMAVSNIQSGVDLVANVGMAIGGAIGSALFPGGSGPTGSLRSIGSDIANIANNYFTQRNAKNAPDSYNGSAANQSAALNGNYGYRYYNRTLTYDIAKSIDDYFTMFGYKINTVKFPDLNARTRFTYLKTADCDIGGPIPSDDKVTINTIFNSGIRFWNDKSTFGVYSIDNPGRDTPY